MSEVSYSNVPPMMAAIKSGDIEAIRSLLHAGHSPNEPQCYQVMIGEWPRDGEASPLELAVLENRMDMVQLLIECGADLTHNPEELLCGSLRSQDLTLFSFLVDVGAVSYTHLLFQLPDKIGAVFTQMLQLLYNIGVQHVAVTVFHIADMTPAALLHRAEVGIDRLPFYVPPLGHFGAHVLAAVAADKQAGEQGHIACLLYTSRCV